MTLHQSTAHLRLEPLVAAQVQYLSRNVEAARRLLRRSLPAEHPREPFGPDHLERAIAAWFASNLSGALNLQRDRYAIALAAAWGDYLSRTQGFRWYLIYTDDRPEMGMFLAEKGLTVYPFATVNEAFDQRDYDLLSTITRHARLE